MKLRILVAVLLGLALSALLVLSPLRSRALRVPVPADVSASLYEGICRQLGSLSDPTGIVRPDEEGEQEAQRLRERLAEEHPDWDAVRIEDELVFSIYTPARRERLTKAFQWSKGRIEGFISRQPDWVLSPTEKARLVARIRAVALEVPPPRLLYADHRELISKADVYYERFHDGRARLRVGGGYLLAASSWFNLTFTLAHELAHAVDPCELKLGTAPLSVPAFDRLTRCFFEQGLVAARETRVECGRDDQLSETFADWLAVQVAAEALEEFTHEYEGKAVQNAAANSVRDLCEEEETERDREFHPDPRVRIDRIFGSHPEIRELLGCPKPKGLPYCKLD